MFPLPDPQEVLQRGAEARELLAHPTFLSVWNDLSSFHLAGIVASPPGPKGQEAREYHHQLHYAINEIATQLQARIDAADEIARRADDIEDDED